MKTIRAKHGPFTERPFYSDADIENMCSNELRAVDLYPRRPGPIRIDRFLEKRFKVVPHYEDLGEKILGMTIFSSAGVKAIIVSRALEEDGGTVAERRIRTTLAHEGGHAIFHTYLFALAMQEKSLFGDFSDPRSPKVLCRDEGEMSNGYQGQWWEYQANRAIGSLLMPKALVEAALEKFLVVSGLLGCRSFDHSRRDEAIKLLVDIFDVNPVVAKMRLSELFPVSESRQLSL